MTVEHGPHGLARPLGIAIWFTMSLAVLIQTCALIGWAFGRADWGIMAGLLLHSLFWLWLLGEDCSQG